ncbi:hypothetical protein [Ornithinicoccus hortensis]|uniref:Uncharacterized protein n=1 Tax=Ornithinicoccus hortensis TaxID=82346 RepID=A0A542YM93_9MICO|nr:hypothetical protein [Ornithinicoccus hortensis]TQL49207.1 hypothetical protein FB467_0272 [Ornithinicoccus hortensis]
MSKDQLTAQVDEALEHLRQTKDAIGRGFDALQLLGHLRAAQERVDAAVEEAMAASVLAGHSVRSVAEVTGLAPGSIPPRLARAQPFAGYTDPRGRVGAPEIARARHDHTTGTPLTFVPRRRSDGPT